MLRKQNRPLSVLVDVDGVLASQCILADALNQASGLSLSVEDWGQYNIGELYGMSPEEMVDAWLSHEVLSACRPLPMAQQGLVSLHNRFQVHIITHRGWHPDAYRLTCDWLDREGFPYDSVTVVPYGTPKSYLYPDHADRFYALFEDSIDNLVDAERSGRVDNRILIDQPWNRNSDELSKLSRVQRKASLCEAAAISLQGDTEPCTP